jgi:hypothetical protein
LWNSAGSLNALGTHYLEERKKREKRFPSDDASATELKLKQGVDT